MAIFLQNQSLQHTISCKSELQYNSKDICYSATDMTGLYYQQDQNIHLVYE